MASIDDNINYSGPSQKWVAPPQYTVDRRESRRSINDGFYHDLDQLRRNLEVIVAETTDTVRQAEESLSDFNLSIDPTSDLSKAQEAEWPEDLGDFKEYITYPEFKVMGFRSTRGSNFIRKEYNNAVRGAWGTVASDVAIITSNIKDEAIRIQNFLDNYISGDSHDQSQQRAIELFQDWTIVALESSGQFRYLLAAKDKPQERYTQLDLDETTPTQAKEFQAILQVQLNQASADVDKIQEDLQKHLGANAELFYNSYLGPSLKFRRQISAAVDTPTTSSKIVQEMYSAAVVLDDNTKSFIADMMKRNKIFTDKMGKLGARVFESDMRRKTILDLATKGVQPKNLFIPHVQISDEKDHFEIEARGWEDGAEQMATSNYTNPAYGVVEQNRFASNHGSLADRIDPQAHPQYLLNSGGVVLGDISVATGVTIDGVDLDVHAHTGADGSTAIDGSSITAGTIPITAFVTDNILDDINDFRLVGYDTAVTNLGELVYDATVAWEGPDDTQFEVQISRL